MNSNKLEIIIKNFDRAMRIVSTPLENLKDPLEVLDKIKSLAKEVENGN